MKRWAAGYMLLPTTSGVPKDEITNQPDIIRHNPGGKPEFIFPPFGNLQGYSIFLQRLETSMEERLALPAAMRGQMPKGAKAARTVELLQEQAEQIQQPIIEDLATSWVQFWYQILGWLQMFYNEETITGIVGEDKQSIVASFKEGTLPDDWRNRLLITVDTGGSLPTSRVARMQAILDLSRKDALFGKPGTPEHARMLRQALGFPSGYLEAQTDLDRSIAQSENTKLRAGGQQINPNPWDDDETHLSVHQTYIKQLWIGGATAQDVMGLWQHIQATQAQLQQKQKAMGPAVEAQEKDGPTIAGN